MKKYFYSFLLFAVALVSTATLVSCGDDDEGENLPPTQQTDKASLDFQLWVTEDLQKIADIKATGISTPLNCTNKYTLTAVNPLTAETLSYEGLVSQNIHLEGDQAKNAKINVTFELKSNWKEIIAGQEEVKCRYKGLHKYNGHTNIGVEIPEGTVWNVKEILADEAAENAFVSRISRMSVSFSAAGY